MKKTQFLLVALLLSGSVAIAQDKVKSKNNNAIQPREKSISVAPADTPAPPATPATPVAVDPADAAPVTHDAAGNVIQKQPDSQQNATLQQSK
ncbi:MAG TPA: hypothetical protein VL098_09760 [Flavipsychrobacter sp.]|nr:hypothetical protein [Flavipsychrobacter sp.]